MVIPANLRRQVITRAANCCEYRGLAQTGQEATFHIDHVMPVVAGGHSSSENLALACVSCSLRKGARLASVDPHTGQEVLFFDPRRDAWRLHFRWDGMRVVGIAPTGRATAMALHMNRPLALVIREEEAQRGRHPSMTNAGSGWTFDASAFLWFGAALSRSALVNLLRHEAP